VPFVLSLRFSVLVFSPLNAIAHRYPLSLHDALPIFVQPNIHHNSYWLQVIDYRYDIHHKTNFKIFLSALEQLRRMMSFTGVLIATTLKKERKVLKAQGFTRFKKRIVVSTFPFKHQKTNNYFISNLADSDWAMHNSFGEFNFKQ